MADADHIQDEVEPTVDPVVAPEVPEVPPVEESPQSTIRDYLSGKGYDMGAYEDDSQVLEQFETLAKDVGDLPHLRQYAGLGQQFAQLQSDPEFQEWQASRQRRTEAAPAKKSADEFDLDSHFGSRWKAPEFDQQWMNLVEEDGDTGQLVSRLGRGGVPLASPEIVERTNQYVNWYRQSQREFLQNPFRQTYDALKDPILHEVRALVQAEFEQRQATQQKQTAQQKFDQYCLDPASGVLDQAKNLTAKGRELESLLSQGVSEELAIQLVERLHPSQAATQAPTPQQTALAPVAPKPTAAERNAARKETFLQRASREATAAGNTNRDATVATAARNGTPQNEKLDFGQMLVQEMREQGFTV